MGRGGGAGCTMATRFAAVRCGPQESSGMKWVSRSTTRTAYVWRLSTMRPCPSLHAKGKGLGVALPLAWERAACPPSCTPPPPQPQPPLAHLPLPPFTHLPTHPSPTCRGMHYMHQPLPHALLAPKGRGLGATHSVALPLAAGRQREGGQPAPPPNHHHHYPPLPTTTWPPAPPPFTPFPHPSPPCRAMHQPLPYPAA